MKATQCFILFLVLACFIVVSANYDLSLMPRTDVQFDQFTIEFDGMNATGEIEYNTGFLTDLYVFLFGSRNIDPYIDDFLYDFKEYRIVSYHGSSVTVELTNSTRIEKTVMGNQRYLHSSCLLGSPVQSLVMVLPDGGTLSFENVSATTSVHYDYVPATPNTPY